MFCPSCGAEYTIELKYCNRCGANLGAALEPHSPPVVVNITKPALILGALLLLITLGGFGVVVAGAMSLAPFLGGSDPVMALIFFGMVLILVVDIFLVRLLSKMVNASLASSTQSHGTQRSVPVPHQAPYLRPQTTSGLHPASVTESTTRFFEPQPLRPETADPAAGQKLKP